MSKPKLNLNPPKHGETLIVGEMRLKRTFIQDPRLVRLHLTHDDYVALTSNAMFSGLTIDEYIRNLIKQDFKYHENPDQ